MDEPKGEKVRFSSRHALSEWNDRMFRKFGNAKAYGSPNPLIAWVENERARRIVAEVAGAKRILDVGCGEGVIMERIGAERVVGLDLSKEALKEARKRLPDANLVYGDAQKLPFKDNSFDAVVCSEVIEHTPEPRRVLKEAARVTKAGGKVVVTIPEEGNIERVKSMATRIGLFKILLPNVPERMEWHLHSFSLKLLRSIAPRELEIEKTLGIPYVHPIRRLVVFRVSRKV